MRLRRLVQLAAPLPVTFHRAIDVAPDTVGYAQHSAPTCVEFCTTAQHGGADYCLPPPGKSPDITLHAFVPNALKGAWEEALFSWMLELAKPRSRAIGPQISQASSPRQTAALVLIDSPPPRAEDGDVCECPATRAVEEPAVR